MKIIISPAKKMNQNTDDLPHRHLPEFLSRAEMLRDYLRGLSYEDLKKLLRCNDQIARLNYERFADMDLQNRLTPAILAYEGIQYQYMAPAVFTENAFDYAEKHLRILSGFYGVLRPFDGVTPYRLEMQAGLKTDFCSSLYDFWKGDIAQSLLQEGEDAGGRGGDQCILNLASEEYAKAVRPWLPKQVRFITPVFGELVNGKVKEKGVYVKMARGEMVRYMAENQLDDVGQIREFDRLGYRFSESFSGEDTFVFIKESAAGNE